MHHPTPRGRAATCALGAVALAAAIGVAPWVALPRAAHAAPSTRPLAELAPGVGRTAEDSANVAETGDNRTLLGDSLYGRSGKLKARLVSARRWFELPILSQLFGDSALRRPGILAVQDSAAGRSLSFITLLPFDEKKKGRIGTYLMGFWPGERRAPRSAAYANPDGFVVVTPDNQDTYVSEHFRLRDFLTHDQQDVWPKYLVLREELLDKLELVIDDLNEHGVRADRITIMSGFRTPQYNRRGIGRGRVKDSRHQFGDAADVFVDNDGDGRMDDLNGDGRVDTRDAQVIIDAVDRVESAHPDLVGGAGRYRANRAHGPFAHIDVRGNRARWGNA